MRQVFIHLHIPKCGGTTVSDFLYRNFGPRLLLTNGALNDYQYSAEQIEKIIDHHPQIECISGHKLSANLPFYRTDFELKAFTWVRDPIDRFISHYFYHRHHTTKVPEAKKMTLPEYAEWALGDGNQMMYVDGQSRFLSGGGVDLSKIKTKVDEGGLLLFPLPKLQESFYTLAHSFPSSFRDVSIQTKNISTKDQPLTEDIRSSILPYVSNDLKLVQMANETSLNNVRPDNQISSVKSVTKSAQKIAIRYLRGAANFIEKSY